MLKKVEGEQNIGNFSHPEIFREVFIGNKRGRFSANYYFSKKGNEINVCFFKYAFVSVNRHGKDHASYGVSSIKNIPEEIIGGIKDRFEKLGIISQEDDIVWNFKLEEAKKLSSHTAKTVEDLISGTEE